LETKHFTQLFQSYCLDEYQGGPPKNAIHIHLQPLIEATWWMSLVQRGITDNKSLEEVIEINLEESDARNRLHFQRMELLRTKKSGTHSDFLYCLEQQADLIEMKTLTQEALVSHLFLEQSDQEMAKICQDILSKNPLGDLPLLRQEIKCVKSSTWYSGGTHKVKLSAGKHCSDCNSQTHDKKNCWGECIFCKKRGHTSSDYRYKEGGIAKRVEEEKKEKKTEAKAKKAAKNKKMQEKKKEAHKLKADEAKKVTGIEEFNSSSSSSETESPVIKS
jgi:superfamily II DNA helicase RecQ